MSDGTIKYSVLIPVRNTADYIRQCLDSVLAQTYQNFEVVIVDNRSTDGSEAIIDDYARRDGRIKVIHQENQGLLMSRRRAIAAATGDYCCFLDSDDYWAPNLLETVNAAAIKSGSDIISYSYTEVAPSGTFPRSIYATEGSMTAEEYMSLVFGNAILNNMWLKAVRRSLFDGGKDALYEGFGILNRTEGGIQTLEVLEAAKTVCVVNAPLYYYRVFGQGATSSGQLQVMTELRHQYECLTSSRLADSLRGTDGYAAYEAQFLFNVFLVLVRIGKGDEPFGEKKKKFKQVVNDDMFKRLMSGNALQHKKFGRRVVLLLAKHRLYYPVVAASKIFGKA